MDTTRPYSQIAHGATGANQLWMDGGDGTVNTSDASLKTKYVAAMNQMGLGSLRWPCGTRANLFRWQRAIGPVSSRTAIPLGQDGSGYSSEVCYFGPDECGRLKEQTGMDITVLINCATADSGEAADLVEYLNAPAGTNPRGGIAWADVRAANGHPAPYGFKYFEIGNEYNLQNQNYWLDPLWGNRTAYAQTYALGGSTVWVTNGVVKTADFSPAAMLGDGTANQVRFARWPPVDGTKAFTLYVAGQAWTCVTNLSLYGSTSQVYTLDFPTGKITFGDGTHGAKPASGAGILLSYTCGRHDGFVDYYREMKAVDPSIKIYTPMDWSEFCSVMGTSHPYDGLVRHMYPSYGVPVVVADSQDAWAWRVTSPQYFFYNNIADHYGIMAKSAGGRTRNMDVVVTEYGGPDLSITSPDPAENVIGQPLRDAFWHALVMQASAAYGLPLCMKHMLISNDGASDEKKQFLFHVGSEFPATALGHAAGQVARLKDGQLLASWTLNNPVAATYSTYGQRQALQVTAARQTDNALWLLVFNVDRTNDYTTTVDPMGFKGTGAASKWTVNGAYDWSNNWDGHTNDVTTTLQTISIGSGQFACTFPRHSITVLRVPRAAEVGGWQPIRDYTFTGASTASNTWYPAVLEWYLAGKAAAVNASSLDPSAGFALQLAGADPSHGRATLTFPSGYTNGLLRLTADVWSSHTRTSPLYITLGDDNRSPVAGIALSYNRDGLIATMNASGGWDAMKSSYYQDNWIRLDIVLDLDARRYDVMMNGYKLFVGGEGRSAVTSLATAINKATFETGTNSGDTGLIYIDNVTVARFVTNSPPVLQAITNRTLRAGQWLFITNTASDSDLPGQSLSWSLAGSVTNAALAPLDQSSLFTWRPTIAQAPSQANFQIAVQDNGIPPMSSTQSFQVNVTLPATPAVSSIRSDSGSVMLQIAGDSGPDYSILASTNLVNWESILTTNPSTLPLTLALPMSSGASRFFRVQLGP